MTVGEYPRVMVSVGKKALNDKATTCAVSANESPDKHISSFDGNTIRTYTTHANPTTQARAL